MSKPLYLLRAECALACEHLAELLGDYTEREELQEALDNYCCQNDRRERAAAWIEEKIQMRDRRTRGHLLTLWQDLIDATRDVYEAERAEVAELIACGGRVA